MILFEDKKDCCGCSACFQACPKKAITMIEDEKGFNYPQINDDLCINCGICENVCPLHTKNNQPNLIKEAYAFQHKSREVLKKSSSGGAFIAISDYVLENGGVVYGSIFDGKDFSVHHTKALNKEERDSMCGSKYVQSRTDDTFKNIKEDLKAGKKVLFTGTPCQNAALVKFLRKRPDNLYMVDLLCHGAPSNKILKDHISYWENKTNKKVIDFKYRSKRFDHMYAFAYACEMQLDNGKYIYPIESKRLIKLYTYNMRKSCYSCPFASRERYGDLTIGDFWSPEQTKDIKNYHGSSLIFVNNERGKKLLDHIKDNGIICQMDPNSFKMGAITKPVEYEKINDEFWNDYFEHGYKYVLDKYAHQSTVSTVYNMMWRTLYHLRLHKLAKKLGLK